MVDDFARDTERFRRELLAHCYRMMGSVQDAEDVVQETYLRAWRGYQRFEGRSSIRTWLYRIATNACLNALRGAGRRALPSGLGDPSDDPLSPPEPAAADVRWVQPIPDALVTPDSDDPAAIATSRESLRLALVASLQHLPPSQRAVLILRDVLAWSADEVAEALGTSTVAVKSSLQRARARMAQLRPAPDQIEEPSEAHGRALLEAYLAAFENSDPAALTAILRADASLELPGSRTWFSGNTTCIPFLAAQALGEPGDWRMLPIAANGQPALAAYRRDDSGAHRAFGVAVLTVTGTGISRVVAYGDAGLLDLFGLPSVHPADR
nr:sigma-70 family RNA polymerase sigma factor [Pseudonocardia spinosispora]